MNRHNLSLSLHNPIFRYHIIETVHALDETRSTQKALIPPHLLVVRALLESFQTLALLVDRCAERCT